MCSNHLFFETLFIQGKRNSIWKLNVFDNISKNECTQRDEFTLSSPNSNSCNTSSDSWNTSTSPVVFLSKPVNSLRNPNKERLKKNHILTS